MSGAAGAVRTVMTGHLLGNRYRLGDRIGRGGMSVVYRGRDERLGRDVAIKQLRTELAGDPAFQARFRREALTAAPLNHPAIVAVYDTGETATQTGPVPYIVMEYVDGDTLRELLNRDGPPPPRRAMQIVADICAALDFSHRRGIVHRDVRPATVMVTRAGAVKVMDFGVTRAGSDGQAPVTAAAIDAARYVSPEQARGEAMDARSDVYATGCVLYELLTGSPPFTGDSPVAIANQHVREAPRPPSESRPGLAPELDVIVLTALTKNPLNRYQAAAQLRSALVRALSGQATLVTPAASHDDRTELISAPPPAAGSPPLLSLPAPTQPGPDRATEERQRPHRRWAVAGLAAVGLALAAAIWLTLAVVTAPPPTPLVAVPDLTGLTVAQAAAVLQDSRLTLGTLTPTTSSQANKDKVVGQRPSGQTQVTQDTTVNLQIGTGVSPGTGLTWPTNPRQVQRSPAVRVRL
jgi:eukaryotic-like serine/threonine-protein kinase